MAITNIKRIFEFNDGALILSTSVLVVFGLTMISSLSFGEGYDRLISYIIAVVIGLIVFFILGRIETQQIRTFAIPIYIVCCLLMLSVLIFGETLRGTRGWFLFGPLSLQPVEYMKVALIIALASFFERTRFSISLLQKIIRSGLITLLPVILTLMQPDLGSALVLFTIWFVMILTQMNSRLIILFLIGVIGVIIVSWFFLLQDYQKTRITGFIDPNADPFGSGYNIRQSMIAVGSGRLFGRGIGEGSQGHLRFLPEAATDFPFAVIAEELGFLGVTVFLIVVGIFFSRIFRCLKVGRDDFSIFAALGIGTWFLFQMVVNIGMNIGLMPIIGIPLPFVSYGGSAMIASFIGAGLILSISFHARAGR